MVTVLYPVRGQAAPPPIQPIHAGGKIGLRQQNNLYWGDYRDLRVDRLLKDAA